MKKVFLTLMVCAGLAACTSDDVVIGTTSDSAFNGGDLYMQVFISDVKDGGTRATGMSGENNSYSNGTADEYAVNDAKFYFYDKDGVFISRASVWDAGNVNETDGTSVEYTSGTMIVLKGLTSTQLPKYMVTILNEPSDFEDAGTYDPANTLGELEQKLVDGCMNGNYFIMSTSSYTQAADQSDETSVARSQGEMNYFVTEISESNFLEEPVTSNIEDAVQVYVERLAAKVEVKVDGLTGTTTTDGDTYYELDITVGGTANDYNEYDQEQGQGQGTSSTVSDGVDQVYVKFLGWKLNATARQSYIMKNVDDEAWDGSGYWAGTWNVKAASWNDATNYRSYWGKGTAYGTGSFPTTNINSTTGESNTDSEEASASTGLNDYLQYTSLKDDLINISTGETGETVSYGYCAENTNVVDSNGEGANGIKDAYSSGITSVLLKAQAYQKDANSNTGYSPLALVNYGGFYWTVDGFKDEVAREEVNYDIKHVSTLATEAGLGTMASVLDELVGYMDPELYCATKEIDSQSWDATSDEIKTFDGSFLGLVDLGNGGVGIWPKDSGTQHTGDSSAEISSKYSPVYVTTDPETEKYPAKDDLDNYYLYLKITDYSSWRTSISGTVLSSSAVQGADGNYYFYLDEENTLGSYTYRQFFVKALEMEADETNDYFAGIIDADGSSVTTTSSAAPNLYYDGQMYYSIPIEHLVSAPESTSESEGIIVEGQYGVVRNHWYTISITGLSKLGKGISNENAVIVPDPEGVDTWLLPAQVNINAWMKVGDQKVSL